MPASRDIDTSAWIAWFAGNALGRKLGKHFFSVMTSCIVSAIVQLELSRWLFRVLGEDQADQVIVYTQKCVVLPFGHANSPARGGPAPRVQLGYC
ncbi:MAG: hypothetical protein RET84_23775 [Pseudomonadota bacterium]|nr:hypothetical protein [Pseudomonadota bacterium]